MIRSLTLGSVVVVVLASIVAVAVSSCGRLGNSAARLASAQS